MVAPPLLFLLLNLLLLELLVTMSEKRCSPVEEVEEEE